MEDEHIREFSKKILSIHEEERRRISRDLHDETGQLSVSLGSSLNVIEKEIEKKNLDRALRIIKDAKSILSESTRKIKKLALDLRPAELDILGLASVLRENFSYYTKTYPLKINFKENVGSVKLPEHIAITLYRVVQESLNNIVKHADAKNVKIDLLTAGNDLTLIIEDDGKGFDTASSLNDGSLEKLGLRGMKERVRLLNGKFELYSRPRSGTRITVNFQIEE